MDMYKNRAKDIEPDVKQMRKATTWVEPWTIHATSRLLGRNINIVTSKMSSTTTDYRMSKIEHPSNRGEPFLLGHLGEHHYVSVGMLCFRLAAGLVLHFHFHFSRKALKGLVVMSLTY